MVQISPRFCQAQCHYNEHLRECIILCNKHHYPIKLEIISPKIGLANEQMYCESFKDCLNFRIQTKTYYLLLPQKIRFRAGVKIMYHLRVTRLLQHQPSFSPASVTSSDPLMAFVVRPTFVPLPKTATNLLLATHLQPSSSDQTLFHLLLLFKVLNHFVISQLKADAIVTRIVIPPKI